MQPRKLGLYAIIAIGAGLVLAVAWGVLSQRKTVAPTVNNSNANANANVSTNVDEPVANSNSDEPLTDTSFFTTNDLPDRDSHFNFSANLPEGWAADSVAGSQAINFFDPSGEADTDLNRSQIFVRYFESSEFETLSTVDILSRTETTINGRPAVTYVIKKKASVPDFPSQPTWRNQEHRVTDIRSTDASPTIFYVFAKAPAVTNATFDTFLNSVVFTSITAGR
jgi:hypothetical protein